MTGSFTVSSMRPIREGMTVSRSAGIRGVTWFSLGADTDISRESYDVPTLYLCAEGRSEFLLGEGAQNVPLLPGELLIVPGKTLCGVQSPEGVIYTEIIAEKEINMNNAIQSRRSAQARQPHCLRRRQHHQHGHRAQRQDEVCAHGF